MNDLITIERMNARAVEQAIPHQLAAGKSAVLEYNGLNFTGARFFDSAPEAQAAFDAATANKMPGERFELRLSA
jgi:hypothetical protein